MIRLPLITCLCAFAIAACGDLPQPTVPDVPTDQDPSHTQTLKPEPPELSTHTTRFGYASIPLRGTAEKNTNVIVTGGAAPTAIDVSATGNFCVDVALNQGKNTLQLYTQRVDNSRSDAITYTVTFDPSLAETPTDTTAPAAATSTTTTTTSTTGQVRDIALHKAVGSSVNATNPAAMTDGDDGTYSSFTDYPSLYIDLGNTYSIQKIEIVWSESATTTGRYADEYDVFTSLQSSPTRPMDTTTPGWSVVSSVIGASGGNGDGGTDTFEVGTPITARWVGITVNSNNTSLWSWDWGVEIASIKVTAPEIITTVGGGGPIGPPTCDNAGF